MPFCITCQGTNSCRLSIKAYEFGVVAAKSLLLASLAKCLKNLDRGALRANQNIGLDQANDVLLGLRVGILPVKRLSKVIKIPL